MIKNEDERFQMGINSDILFEEKFESSKVCEQFFDLFNEVINNYFGE